MGRFQLQHAKTIVIQVYAPTKDANDATKDAFYDQLQDIMYDVPSCDIKLLIGDMTAKIESKRQGWNM